MTEEKLRELLQQYFDHTISPSDCKGLLEYLDIKDPAEIATVMDEVLFALPEERHLDQTDSDNIYKAILSDERYIKSLEPAEDSPRRISFKWYYTAASVLVLLTAGLLLYRPSKQPHTQRLTAERSGAAAIITPGSKKATLTLGNGKVIDLEAQQKGILQGTGDSGIRKVKSGQIVYQAGQASAVQTQSEYEAGFNNLQTPKGGEYQITLPDGTKVWLNSASSLRFPAAFKGVKRQVILNGEAYFEVAKNAAMPFVVAIGKTEIKVLGTHFNVAGYQDDEIATTTLLEGSVQLTKGKNQRLLSPGQQASVSKNSDQIQISQANVAQAMAWKNGYFRFDDQDIRSIMKQVSRWYDVEVEFKQNQMSNKQFGGTFYRNKSIAELLSHLEQLDPHLHFKIIGRRIEIME